MLIKVIMAVLRRFYRHVKWIARNPRWDRLAWVVRYLKQDMLIALKNYYGDKKLGIDTGFYNDIIVQNINEDSEDYEGTTYADIQKLIAYLKFGKNDVFIDFGCGKGRIICCLATQKLKKIIGVELDDKMMKVAKANIGKLRLINTPIELVNMDANNFNPIEGTIFFLFNSFGEKTLKSVLSNIKDSLSIHPRKIRFVYHNSKHNNILEKLDWLEAEGFIDNSSWPTTVWRNKFSQSIAG